MTKRRRERDRPKAGPDSTYNPNKRVLLSYDSDDDAVEQPVGVQSSSRDLPETGADRTVVPYSNEDEVEIELDDDEGDTGPGFSDQLDEEAEEAASSIEAAPLNQNNESRQRRRVKNHATGQWAALGSLSYQYDEEAGSDEIESEEAEAMAYLRAVRSERMKIPEILAAGTVDRHQSLYESGVGDSRGFFEDGAYVARGVVGPNIPESAKVMLDPQEAYTRAIKRRFLIQREALFRPPAEGAIDALDIDHPITFPAKVNKACADWLRYLQTVPPHPDQLRGMDQTTVASLLELLQKHLLVREKSITAITSAWIWALLARLDEVGTMNNDQVSTMREFGKQAVLVQVSFDSPEAAAQLELGASEDDQPVTALNRESTMQSSDDAGYSVNGPVPGDSDSKADARNKTADRQNTLATLDAILVIVGELFGQRDLLEFRQTWPTIEVIPT